MTIDAARIEVGDRIPTWEREATLHHWNRFAGANYEFAGHHMDDEVGRHEGFSGAFAMAPLTFAYLHAMLRAWTGDDGDARIVTVDLRIKSPLLRGRILSAGGEVTAIRHEGPEVLVDLDIWQTDDEGTTIGQGVATVAIDAPR